MSFDITASSYLARLYAAISAVCPIVGTDGTTITFDPSATSPQRTAAAAVLAGFNPADNTAQQAFEAQQIVAQKSTDTPVTGSLASPVVITAAGGLTIDPTFQKQIIFVKSDGGIFGLTADPQITPGQIIGQELIIIGTDPADAIAFIAGAGVAPAGATIQPLYTNFVLSLIWTGLVWANISNALVDTTV